MSAVISNRAQSEKTINLIDDPDRDVRGAGHSPPPGHLPPYEKWHVWTSAPQAIDRGG